MASLIKCKHSTLAPATCARTLFTIAALGSATFLNAPLDMDKHPEEFPACNVQESDLFALTVSVIEIEDRENGITWKKEGKKKCCNKL